MALVFHQGGNSTCYGISLCAHFTLPEGLSHSCCISSPFSRGWGSVLLSLLGQKRLEAWRWWSAFLRACESPLWARGHITWIHVSVPKLVSPSESPWDTLVQALSHTNTAACLCLNTQLAETGYFCFLSLHKSTRYILSDPALRFARKNHGLKNSRFFNLFQHLEESSFAKHLGMICIALNVMCVRYCRVCICIYAERAMLQKEVCL